MTSIGSETAACFSYVFPCSLCFSPHDGISDLHVAVKLYVGNLREHLPVRLLPRASWAPQVLEVAELEDAVQLPQRLKEAGRALVGGDVEAAARPHKKGETDEEAASGQGDGRR